MALQVLPLRGVACACLSTLQGFPVYSMRWALCYITATSSSNLGRAWRRLLKAFTQSCPLPQLCAMHEMDGLRFNRCFWLTCGG